MKETFKIFKFDDGKYFRDFCDWGIQKSDTLTDAFWINDYNKALTDELKNLKGELVTATISDDEQPTFTTVTVSDDEQPTLNTKEEPTFITRKEPATFKGKIAMIKREQNLSEETLSGMLGCGKSTVHDWLHGSVPSRKFRKKIEDLYKFYYEE